MTRVLPKDPHPYLRTDIPVQSWIDVNVGIVHGK